MKKSILNTGKALNKAEQKQINGGNPNECWECLPDAPKGSIFACAGNFQCLVMPDGCHICEC